MADIFVSYAKQDGLRAKDLSDSLMARGWSVWWDRSIPPGQSWDQVLERELHAARCVVVCWSRKAIESHWVKTEANEALQRQVLIPVLIENVTPPLAFRLIQAANLVGWRPGGTSPEFDHVLDAVRGLVGRDPQMERLASDLQDLQKFVSDLKSTYAKKR